MQREENWLRSIFRTYDKHGKNFMLHLRERKVNIYSLLGFNNFNNVMSKIDPNIGKFVIPLKRLKFDPACTTCVTCAK